MEKLMKLRCKLEAINDHGLKIMNFTKGNEYEVYDRDSECYYILDDECEIEEFFELNIMFDVIDDINA